MATNSLTSIEITSSVFQTAVHLCLLQEQAYAVGDEDLADKLLEDSELYMRKLSWDQNEWLRHLSGDLHMLDGNEVFLPREMSQQDYAIAATRAWLNIENDPEEMLRLSRYEQDMFSPDQVAYARSRAYKLIGMREIAHAFLVQAMKFNPEAIEYKSFVINNLYSKGSFYEAWEVAESIFTSRNADAEVIFVTCGVMEEMLLDLESEVARPYFGKLRQVLVHEFHKPATATARPDLKAFGLVILGVILEKLKRTTPALSAYTQSINLDPFNAIAYLLRGRLLYKRKPSDSIPDFKQALAIGATDYLAVLIVARDMFEKEQFSECQTMAQRLLEANLPYLRSQAFELLAICEARVNGPTLLAEEYLRQAIEILPDSKSLAINMQILLENRREQQLRQGTSSSVAALGELDSEYISSTKQITGQKVKISVSTLLRELATRQLTTIQDMAA